MQKIFSPKPGYAHTCKSLNEQFEHTIAAALTGDCECATLLLRQGASMNLRDTDGKTPLMMAVVNNHVDLVKILLESGADLTLKNEVSSE